MEISWSTCARIENRDGSLLSVYLWDVKQLAIESCPRFSHRTDNKTLDTINCIRFGTINDLCRFGLLPFDDDIYTDWKTKSLKSELQLLAKKRPFAIGSPFESRKRREALIIPNCLLLSRKGAWFSDDCFALYNLSFCQVISSWKVPINCFA